MDPIQKAIRIETRRQFFGRSALGLGGCDVQDPLRYLQRLEDFGGDGQQPQLGREYLATKNIL